MVAFVRFLLRHRTGALLVLVAVTAAFAAVLPEARLRSTLTGLFFDDDSAYVRFQQRIAVLGTDEVLLVGVPAPEPLAPDTTERLARAVRAIEDVPEVERVVSVLDAQRIRADAEGIEVVPYADEVAGDPARAGALAAELARDRRSAGIVVGKDGTDLAVAVELTHDESRAAEDGPRVVAEIERAFAEAGLAERGLRLGGPVAVVAALIRQTYRNFTVLLPASLVALAVTGLVLFRRLFPVAITLAVSSVAVLWTFGGAILVDRDVNVFLSVAPLFILVLAFSEVVHLSNAYLLELGAGRSQEDAIVTSAAEVGAACLLTSATTFLGFASLALVPTPIIRSFGLALGFGVGATLVIALVVTPIVLSVLPAPRVSAPGTRGGGGVVGRLVGLCDRLTSRHPRAIVAAFAAATVLSAVGMARLRVDTSFVDRFAPSNPVREAHDYFAARFAGTDYLSVLLETDAADGWVDPERVAALARFAGALEREPGVDRALSLADLLDAMDRAVRPGLARPDASTGLGPMPGSREAIAQYLLLYELGSGAAELGRVLDAPRRTTQVLLRVHGLGLRELNALGERARALGERTFGPGVTVEAGSVFHFLGGWLDEMVAGQRRGLLFSIFTISIVVTVGLRSVRTGLAAMIPNLVPLAFLGGWLGLTRDAVDSDAMVVAMIALGIADDDTIHFVTRLREEAARGGTLAEVVSRTYHYAGRAIVAAAVILTVGFLPLATSDYLSIRMLGTYLPGTILVAVATELLLTPALVHTGILRIPGGAGRPSKEGAG